jgi:hypothetical protein
MTDIVDCHHHIWRLEDLPWLNGPVVPRIFGPYEPIQRDYLTAEFRADAESSGISKSVYTQVNWPLDKSVDEVRRAIGDVETKYDPDPLPGTPAYEEQQREPTDDSPGILDRASVGAFPEPPHHEAFGGLVGECVEQMAAGTDSSLAGLLASFLVVCGAMMPAIAYSRGQQTTSPFVVLVGESSIGRKGTAMHRALDAVRLSGIGAAAVNQTILDGINSGEGLITALHARQQHWSATTVGFIFEDEFASLMQSRSRDGSTLDPWRHLPCRSGHGP